MKPIKEKVSKAKNKRQERTIEKPFLQDAVESDIKAKSTTPVFTPEKPADITMSPNAPKEGAVPSVNEITSEAVSTTQPSINVPEVKPLSFSDMLAPMREKAQADKTDAVKMQKYYALTDALNAIGKMGGAAVGGAIGGNMLLGAPNVDEYKESRGYINAFEKAKQANDRLRALDEKEFQLLYNDKQKADDRAYQAEQAALNREWQSERDRINREWQSAVAEKDFERQAALKKEMLNLEQSFKLKYQDIANKHDAAMKNISKEIVEMQTGSNGKKNRTFTLFDGTVANMPYNTFEEMKAYFIDKGSVDGTSIDEDNVEQFLRSRPDLVANFASKHGVDYSTDFVAPEYKTDEEINAENEAKKKDEKASRKAHRKQNQNFYSPTVGAGTRTQAEDVNDYISQFK